jgi:uroporphyrinogen-III decarboxylase
MLAALNCEEPDRVPCSFMIHGALLSRSASYAEFIERQVDMGLDPFVQLPPRPPVVVNDHYDLYGLPVTYEPRVEIQEWIERPDDEPWPILVKEYHTPRGALRVEVRQTEDWRWGNHVPFLDDYIIPRARKHLIAEEDDLEPLRYLLVPPKREELDHFEAEARKTRFLAHEHDLLVTGGWGVGADLIGWLFGLEDMAYAIYDRPDFIRELLEIISAWNRARMEAVLEAGVDLYIKRAWYENCDFWTPTAFREFLLPILAADVELAHEKGARFGTIITSNAMPLLDLLLEAGVDVVIGVDPRAWDLERTKKKVRGEVCLWGGLNGHLTIERGSPEEVRAEVLRALEVLAPGGGFVLSPVDNVREDTPRSRENVRTLIDAWRKG